ncbi:MAG: extracellular solute-binding protein [Clostridia bacterium]|nr:extracellular solute-binding protein [Clostridia bacterium]
MKKTEKIISMLMAGVMCTAVIGGCGSKDEVETGSSGSILDYKVSDKPLTLTYFQSKPTDYDEADNVFNRAFEHTNVKIEFDFAESVTDKDQALALAVSSKDMSDIIYQFSRDTFVKYGKQKAFIPLNDLIDKCAPNFKKYLDEHEDVRKYITASDGNIYYVPNVLDGKTASGWFIRQDWLDKLGMEQPKTIAELEEVFKAFKEKDPNGNGKNDEVPYFGNGSSVTYTLNEIIGIFDASLGFRHNGQTVSFGPMEENFKTAMKTVADWYAKGYIDPEIFTRKSPREHFLSNNIGGCTHNWFGSTAGYNKMYESTVPGIKFIAMAPPASADGVQRELTIRTKNLQEGWAISASNKHPEETMKYFDFFWTEEGRRMANYGIEGKTYNMNGDKIEYTDYILNNPDHVPVDSLRTVGAQTNFGYEQDWNSEALYINKIALDGINMYIDNGYLKGEDIMLTYSEEEEKQRTTLNAQITTCVEEAIQKWVLNNEKVDDSYDKFINDLQNLDVQKLIDIEQAAYDRYLQ